MAPAMRREQNKPLITVEIAIEIVRQEAPAKIAVGGGREGRSFLASFLEFRQELFGRPLRSGQRLRRSLNWLHDLSHYGDDLLIRHRGPLGGIRRLLQKSFDPREHAPLHDDEMLEILRGGPTA